MKKGIFWRFFEVSSVLTEKQRTKLRKLILLKNFASFGTHVAPKLAIIVEQLSVICFVLKFCDESALWWIFFFFQNEACCHLNKLEPYQRLLYTTFDTKVQALQCAMSILYMNLVEIRYISPSVQLQH